MRPPRAADWPAVLALAAILAGGLLLRVRNLDHGLPFVYHPDEAFHFASRAVGMLREGALDPGYFANPSGFTYLLYAVLRVGHGGAPPFRDVSGLLAAYAQDPSLVIQTGRVLATVLCLLAVVAVFAVGRRLWGPAEGVAAAAVLCFAFLPVAYSRYAVTDTGVLLPVALAAYGIVRIHEGAGWRTFALTGAAAGLAVGFKYTAGLIGLPLLVAAGLRARHDRSALAGLGLAVVAGAAAFFLTTPYFFLALPEALQQLREQNEAAENPKLGQGDVLGYGLYLRSLTWGLGWGAAVAALAGAVWELRRNRTRALLLALFPLALFLYLGTAGRFFARWLLPMYPLLALFAGVALAGLAARLARRPALRAVALAALLAAVLAQPILADVRTGTVLGRADTRTLARAWMFRELPPEARIVVEPAVPRRFFDGHFTVGFKAPPRALVTGGTPQRWIFSLEPRRIDRYRRAGYCTVVTMSVVSERARRDGVAPAIAYYRRLERESRLVFRASPYRDGASPPPFSFDFSTHLYYPSAYERPGPDVQVRRLRDCRQGRGGRPARAAPPPWAPRPDPVRVQEAGPG